MRANRGRDTAPELALRSALHMRGIRFRKDLRLDLGDGRRSRPDIVIVGVRLAIFVDGCFWHGCPDHGSLPVANRAFWKDKLDATACRDRDQKAWLISAGWNVVRVWEHEVPDAAAWKIADLVATLRGADWAT